MALFCVNRYLGDEENYSTASERSQILLQKLHEKAKTREQQATVKKDSLQSKRKGPKHDRVCPGSSFHSESPPRTENKKRESEQKDSLSAKIPRRRKVSSFDDSESLAGLKQDINTSSGINQSDSEFTVKQHKTEKGRRVSTGLQNNGEGASESSGEEEELSDSEIVSDQVGTAGVHLDEISDDAASDLEEEQTDDLHEKDTETEELPQSTLTILGGFEKKTVQKVHRILPQWLSQPSLVQRDIKQNLVPIHDIPGIHPKLLKKLQANGIQSFFPVQAEVIPAVLATLSSGFLNGRGGYRPSDICVSAPTGSGKTLAFVIPVVQALMDRTVCQVRALAMLPTKELAQQVCKVFNIYTDGTGLKVALVTGHKSFAVEQKLLVQETITGTRSLADIVVATPGRLVDHINKTQGFSLHHLRFLVIDEADRMIDSMHQDWLRQAEKAVYHMEDSSDTPSLFRRTEPGPVTAASTCWPQMPLQKLLFSATLTRNPEKLQQLGLYLPRLFTSAYMERNETKDGQDPSANEPRTEEELKESSYTLPEGLTDYFVPCTLNNKPLVLLHFIVRMKFSRVLCFTNSREASHRLYILVQHFGGVTAAEFSSRLTPSERQKTLKEFEQGKIQLLISTDAAARGIDIKGVKCVINYDAPQFIRTYIHRVGRTARAGTAGLAFTLLLTVQENNFLQMLRDAGSPGPQRQLVKAEFLKPLIAGYENALAELQKVIKDERARKRV
ncbi:ATP-dependent RNA helicase DDX51 [Protopterus annectens]|uniref:ATP-dependent RNA helicase DDX51 n=1 Tax=Protopterus annectens TaxID=7888 RepID=UPI001CF9B57C|nr:ATP-dependent RNA helicase DDX51 [Protopterus annectens]